MPSIDPSDEGKGLQCLSQFTSFCGTLVALICDCHALIVEETQGALQCEGVEHAFADVPSESYAQKR